MPSREWIIPSDGMYELMVVGGGGGASSDGRPGQDGEIVTRTVWLKAGTKVTINMGRGGDCGGTGGVIGSGQDGQASVMELLRAEGGKGGAFTPKVKPLRRWRRVGKRMGEWFVDWEGPFGRERDDDA